MRTRISLAFALLVAIALTGAGAMVYVIESRLIEQQAVSAVEQELDEFLNLYEIGIDPDTGRRFRDVQPLIETFLRRNVPDNNELLIGWYDGQINAPLSGALAADTRFQETVARLVRENAFARLNTESEGELLITAQSVRLEGSTDVGALVVVTLLDRAQADLDDTMRTYAVVAFLSMLLVLAIAGWQSGRLLAPLRVLRSTAEEIGETDLSGRLPVTGNDDITALTRTVNGMLDRLESAFVGQREFLDDAGHELRTPLTVLRGHLELLDSGSPDEVAETRALLLDEVDRMARLVGDLILLAKSDRPDFLKLSQVRLSDLSEDLVAKARGLGDREWVLDSAARHSVEMDEQRITQAVLQLADNAVKHIPGDEIAIGSGGSKETSPAWRDPRGVGQLM